MPPTWNIGSGVRLTDSASNRQAGTLSVAAARLRCVVRTPFGAPVVPEVYICTTGSPASPLPPGSTASAEASRASYSAPTPTTSSRCGTPAATSAATSANAGPAISSGAPASATIAVSSGTASRQLSGTATAPILAAATNSSTTSGALRSRCATRAPGAGARRQQHLRQPARALVELRVGDRALAVADRDRVGTRGRIPADDVRDPELVEHQVSHRAPSHSSKKRAIASSISGTSVG